MPSLDTSIGTVLPTAIDQRHRLHQIPEIGCAEHKTAELVTGKVN